MSVGNLGSLLKTGASVTSPRGDQKPEVVQSVSGHSGRRSSSSREKMFLYWYLW